MKTSLSFLHLPFLLLACGDFLSCVRISPWKKKTKTRSHSETNPSICPCLCHWKIKPKMLDWVSYWVHHCSWEWLSGSIPTKLQRNLLQGRVQHGVQLARPVLRQEKKEERGPDYWLHYEDSQGKVLSGSRAKVPFCAKANLQRCSCEESFPGWEAGVQWLRWKQGMQWM